MNTQNIDLNGVRDLLHMSYWKTEGLSLKFSQGTFSIVGKTDQQTYDLKEEDGIWIASSDVKYKIIGIDQYRMTLDHEGSQFTLQKVS